MFAKAAIWTTVLSAGAVGAAQAGTVAVDVEVPRLNVAEYHKPYVAAWVEDGAGAHKSNLFVWYQVGKGDKWLKDLRTWWRKGGRAMSLPADGVSGATRAPGRQTVTVPAARLRNLQPGQYNIVVEAARELGGREVVRVPFRWGAANTGAGTGSTELGAVRVAVSR